MLYSSHPINIPVISFLQCLSILKILQYKVSNMHKFCLFCIQCTLYYYTLFLIKLTNKNMNFSFKVKSNIITHFSNFCHWRTHSTLKAMFPINLQWTRLLVYLFSHWTGVIHQQDVRLEQRLYHMHNWPNKIQSQWSLNV